MIFNIFIVKYSGEATSNARLCLCANPLFKFSCILIHKAQQDMLTAYTLAHMPDTWMFLLHPGIDHGFKSGHTIATLRAIKAFKPVHRVILPPGQIILIPYVNCLAAVTIVPCYLLVYHTGLFYFANVGTQAPQILKEMRIAFGDMFAASHTQANSTT